MKFRDKSLPVSDRVQDLIDQLTVEEKVSQLIMKNAPIERLGIGMYHWWSEGLHGYARSGLATVFPQATGLAATWSPAVLRAVGDVTATEARAKYNEELATNNGNSRKDHGITIWSPNINIFRDPRWGRGQETYGEDPFLTAALSDGFVRGLQGDHEKYLKTVATLKHFAVHSGPEPLRHEFDARTSQKDLHDTYLPAFEEGIRHSGACSVMSAYNGFNGEPCVSSHWLLTELLREEWGFDGAVVGDVDNIVDLYKENGHHTAKDGVDAVAQALKAGNDLRSGWEAEHAFEALQQGLIAEADIDRALTRLMTLRFKLGQFDPPEAVPWSTCTSKVITSDAHVRKAYEASRQSLVLLKNDGVLPLSAETVKKVALIGPAGDDIDVLIGNYAGKPYKPVTIYQGLQEKLAAAGAQLLHEPDIDFASGFGASGEPIPTGVFFSDPEASSRGLTCRMYNNDACEGEAASKEIVSEPALEWNPAQPPPGEITADRASVEYTGFMRVQKSGRYSFVTHAQGRAEIKVDGKRVAVVRSVDGVDYSTDPVEIEAGQTIPIHICFKQLSDTAYLKLEWQPVDGGKRVEAAYQRAMDIAKQADVVVLSLGLSHRLEGEEMKTRAEGFHRGDRTSIALPAPQQELVNRIATLNKTTVMLLSSGGAVAFNPDQVNAAMQTWYYGAQGGRAIADALFGEFSPAGRLPVTFYASEDDLPEFDDYAMQGRTYRYFEGKPLYAFGHGLTYTTFDYSDLKVEKNDDGLVASLKVENAGSFRSDEVVQIYASRKDRRANDPIQWLVGFQRLFDLDPGATVEVEIAIPERWLALWNGDARKRVVEPGELTIAAGPASDSLMLSHTAVNYSC